MRLNPIGAKGVSLALLALLALSAVLVGGIAGPLASLTVRPAHAAQPTTDSFVVMITSHGFDQGSLNLTVNQGDTVQITFALDASQINDSSPDNHHIIAIATYDVQSALIDPTHPNATVTFVADKPGSFSIYCASPECPIHYLMLSGQLNVKAPSSQVTTTTTGATSSSPSSSSTVTQTTQTTAVSASSTGTGPGNSGSSGSVGSVSSGQGYPQEALLVEWGAVVAAVGFLVGAVVTGRFILPAKR